MNRKESMQKLGLIFLSLFLGTILLLALLHWYSEKRDVAFLKEAQSGNYELVASRETMSYSQMLEAIEAEDGNSTVVTRNSSLYTVEEARQIVETYIPVFKNYFIYPWNEELSTLVENDWIECVGTEVQIFREFDNQIFSCRIGTLYITDEYDELFLVFDADRDTLLALDFFTREWYYPGEVDYWGEQNLLLQEYYKNVDGMDYVEHSLHITSESLGVQLYQRTFFDFYQNLIDKSGLQETENEIQI